MTSTVVQTISLQSNIDRNLKFTGSKLGEDLGQYMHVNILYIWDEGKTQTNPMVQKKY